VNEEQLSEEQHAKHIISRLRQNKATLRAYEAELGSLIETTIEALQERDFGRLADRVQRLDEWLSENYKARAIFTDTIQLLYYFVEAFGAGGAPDPAEGAEG
jgi:hypothetical protein